MRFENEALRDSCFNRRHINPVYIYRVTQKSKPLPNDQKIVLNRVKACQ